MNDILDDATKAVRSWPEWMRKLREMESPGKQARFNFADDVLSEVRARCASFNVTEAEWVVILRLSSAEARMRLVLPLLRARCPGRRFKHAELAVLTGLCRRQVIRILNRLRDSGEYADEITRRHVDNGCECPPEGHMHLCRFNKIGSLNKGEE